MHRRLAPGITQIATTRRDNAFLVAGDDGHTLVDVGWAGAPGVLLDALADLGGKPGDIRRIVITHAHPDHVQGAADLRHRTGADILVHAADRPWLEAGRVPPEGRSRLPGRLLDRLPKLHWTPVTADGTLADGDLVDGCGGLRVIHTPGHSPGPIVLWHEPSRTLLTGDAVFHRGRLDLGHAALAADPRTAGGEPRQAAGGRPRGRLRPRRPPRRRRGRDVPEVRRESVTGGIAPLRGHGIVVAGRR